MLELRPNCELCDADLPPHSPMAYICSYECTYCKPCVETVLQNVCPTCGGGFTRRPLRPFNNYRDTYKLGLQNNPASQERIHSKWTEQEIKELVQKLKSLLPQER